MFKIRFVCYPAGKEMYSFMWPEEYESVDAAFADLLKRHFSPLCVDEMRAAVRNGRPVRSYTHHSRELHRPDEQRYVYVVEMK